MTGQGKSLEKMGQEAKQAARILAKAGDRRRRALIGMAKAIRMAGDKILKENRKDCAQAEASGMTAALLDRLKLTGQRISAMANGVASVAEQPDPIGTVVGGSIRPNGLKIEQIRVPIGVIGMIYEARPNVTADAAALCLKAGNAVILRGGKEAICSNTAIAEAMREALEREELPAGCIQLVQDTSRQSAVEMMHLTEYLDVLIPRGGKGLIRSVVENSRVPVIETGAGNCHVFVDETADTKMAADIIFNAKTSRPSVCNAIETVLVHRAAAARVLPAIKKRLDEKQVEIHGCEKTREILGESVIPAKEEDWETEYLDMILAVKVVDSLDDAISHIERYSTGHSESILTNSYENARRFTTEVDSAAVYVNSSTRFTDGGEFGLGAEIGISTQKLHARGPMGALALTSSKYIISGNGQIR